MRERYQLERHLVSDICSFPSKYNEVLGVQKENKILHFYKTLKKKKSISSCSVTSGTQSSKTHT